MGVVEEEIFGSSRVSTIVNAFFFCSLSFSFYPSLFLFFLFLIQSRIISDFLASIQLLGLNAKESADWPRGIQTGDHLKKDSGEPPSALIVLVHTSIQSERTAL